jgi:hypothetical protein
MDSDERNWQLIAFLSSSVLSTWALLAEDSYGDSPMLKLHSGAWNDIRLSVGEDKSVSVHVGNELLYETAEIQNLETSFDMNIDTDCDQIGLRTVKDLEIMADDVAVVNIGQISDLNKITYYTGDTPTAASNENPVSIKSISEATRLSSVKNVLMNITQ